MIAFLVKVALVLAGYRAALGVACIDIELDDFSKMFSKETATELYKKSPMSVYALAAFTLMLMFMNVSATASGTSFVVTVER